MEGAGHHGGQGDKGWLMKRGVRTRTRALLKGVTRIPDKNPAFAGHLVFSRGFFY